MNEKIVEVLEKPIGVRIGILVGAVALLAAGYWYFMLQGIQTELSEVLTQVEDLKRQVAEKRQVAANLPKFEEEVARLDIELKKALKELPDKREIDDLLDRISDKARDAGLEIRLFQPTGEKPQDFYAEVPVDIEVLGTYHQLATFFDEVAHLNRIVNVIDFAMLKPNVTEDGVIVETSAVITSFRFLDESERVGPSKEKDGKSRKRRS
jgi:type IV pilus assembly protein PilO